MCISPLAALSPVGAMVKKTKGLGAISPALGIIGALGKKDKKPAAANPAGGMY